MQTKLEQHFHFRPAFLDIPRRWTYLIHIPWQRLATTRIRWIRSIFWRTPGFGLVPYPRWPITNDGRLAEYGEGVEYPVFPHVTLYLWVWMCSPGIGDAGLGQHLELWINRRAMLDLPKAPSAG